MSSKTIWIVLAFVLTSLSASTGYTQDSCRDIFGPKPPVRSAKAEPKGATLTGLNSVGLTHAADVASFLAWVKKSIPDLYTNTKDFPVDFWETLRKRNSLETLLKEFPIYRDYLRHKATLLKMRIQVEEEPHRFDLPRFENDNADLYAETATVEALQKEMANLETTRGPGTSSLLLTDLMFKVDGPDKREMSTKVNIDDLCAYFLRKGGVPDSFRGENSGLVRPWTLESIRARYETLAALDAKILRVKKLLFIKQVLSNNALTGSEIAKHALTLTDKTLKSALSSYVTEVPKSKFSNTDVTLQEIPDSLAQFKSCVGIECTPPRFAALPSERAFFIYDTNAPDKPKGYLGAAVITGTKGRKLLYLKVFQGPGIGPDRAEMILLASSRLARDMDCDDVVLSVSPHSNYTVLWPPWDGFIDRAQGPIKFAFKDKGIRALLDVEPTDPGGVHHSEAMPNISQVYRMKIPDHLKDLHLKIATESHPIRPITMTEPAPLDRIEAGIAYARFMDGKPSAEKARIFRELGLAAADMKAIAQMIKSPQLYTREEFENGLTQHGRTKSDSFSKDEITGHFKYLILANQMRFKDAFNSQNEEKNVTPLVQKVRSLRHQDEYIFSNLVSLEGQPLPHLKKKILELAADANDPEKMLTVSWFVYLLKPEHMTSDFTQPLLNHIRDRMLEINGPHSQDADRVRSNNFHSGYFRIVHALHTYDSQHVLPTLQ